MRPYAPQDKQAVLEMLRHGLLEQQRLAADLRPPEDADFFDRNWPPKSLSLDNRPENWHVAVIQARVAGAIYVKFHNDRFGDFATVDEVVVLPDLRRRGVGRALVQQAIDFVIPKSATRIFVNTLANHPALPLFQGLGFQHLRLRQRYDKNTNHAVMWRTAWLEHGPFRHGHGPSIGPPRLGSDGRFLWDED